MALKGDFDQADLSTPPNGISVIIPAYNATGQLIEAVQSVYKQGLHQGEFEVLVVNDRFSLNREEAKRTHQAIFQELQRLPRSGKYPGLRIIDSCEAGVNCGQSAARNTGMRAASFPIIAFLDADDLYQTDPEFLARHGSYLTRARKVLEGDPDTAFVFSDMRLFGEGGESIKRCGGDNQHDLMVRRLLALDVFIPTIFRRDDALHPSVGGFDTSLIAVEDPHFFTHLMHGRFSRGLGTKIGYFDTPYYCYRQHPPGVETVNRREVKTIPLVLKTIEDCLPLYQHYFGPRSPNQIFDVYVQSQDNPSLLDAHGSLATDAVPHSANS